MEKQAYFQITDRCNQSCVFCLRPSDNPIDINFNKLKIDINSMVEDGVNRVYVTGGEPTLHKDLFKIIRYIKKAGIPRVDLQTNGVNLADKKLVLNLKKAGIETIYFALHDYTEKLSGKTRGVNGYLKKTLAGIRNSIEQGLTTCVVHVIYSGNYKKLPLFIDFLKLNFPNIDDVNLSLISTQGRAMTNKWTIPKYSRIKPYLINAIKKCKEWGVHFNISAKVPLCIIKGYEEYAISTIFMVENLIIFNRYINDAKGDLSSNNKVAFKDIGKDGPNKAPQCKKCTVNKICSGFYEDYAKVWGYDDFIPYKDDIQNILNKFINYKKTGSALTKKK